MIALARDLDAGTFTPRQVFALREPAIRWRDIRSSLRASYAKRQKEAKRRGSR